MKVRLSDRAEADLDRCIQSSLDRFGPAVAAATFSKMNKAFFEVLPATPYVGRRMPGSKLFRYVIARTPFVLYYGIDEAASLVTIAAILHGAQDRSRFDP